MLGTNSAFTWRRAIREVALKRASSVTDIDSRTAPGDMESTATDHIESGPGQSGSGNRSISDQRRFTTGRLRAGVLFIPRDPFVCTLSESFCVFHQA